MKFTKLILILWLQKYEFTWLAHIENYKENEKNAPQDLLIHQRAFKLRYFSYGLNSHLRQPDDCYYGSLLKISAMLTTTPRVFQ